MERIDHWIVLMFENRSFDNLLGYLPHIDADCGIRDREITLRYPGGSVRVAPATDFRAPVPDPGEAYGNLNVQCYGQYRPAENAGRAAYPIFGDFMAPPYNAPPSGTSATMDGFALDYYWNFRWEKERAPTDTQMQTIGGVFTPASAPVINTLASEFAVFTRWFCEAPTCTTPNRNFFFCGTNLGRLDNEFIVNYTWDFTAPSIFVASTPSMPGSRSHGSATSCCATSREWRRTTSAMFRSASTPRRAGWPARSGRCAPRPRYAAGPVASVRLQMSEISISPGVRWFRQV